MHVETVWKVVDICIDLGILRVQTVMEEKDWFYLSIKF